MKSKAKFIKLFTILIIGLVAINLSMTAMDNAVIHKELHTEPMSCFPHHPPATPSEMIKNSLLVETSSPMHRVFQIIFILFVISPPLIVVLLFLIWCELRKRNEHK